MQFAQKFYYCNIEDFYVSQQEAEDAGFHIENGMIVIPDGTRFKYITNAGPSGWPVIEINGIELDFATEEPIKVRLYD